MDDRLSSSITAAWTLLDENRGSDALALLEPRRELLTSVPEFAEVWLAAADALESDQQRIADAHLVARAFGDVPQLVWSAANVLVGIAEERPLDLPPPAEGPAHEAVAMIREALRSNPNIDDSTRAQLYVTLGAALRIISYERDDEIDDAFRRAIAINDRDAWAWFNAGIYYKWRGRWSDGIEANRRTLELNPKHEGALWNLAVCATAAGDTFTATEAYLALGLESRPGSDGLPSMQHIGPIKLRVSLHGTGVSAGAHDPSREAEYESIWVAARSACHGEVISASMNALPVDFGDVVLWDPAPVAFHKSGDLEIPIFPLLDRLREGEYHRLWFVAEQPRGGLLHELGADLPHDVSLYVLDEQIELHCAACESPDACEHERIEMPPRKYVSGKLLIPTSSPIADAAAELEQRFDDASIRLACPDLARLCEDAAEVEAHERLWKELIRLRASELAPHLGLEPGQLVTPVAAMTTMQAVAIAALVAICGGGAIGLIALLAGLGDAAAISYMLWSQPVILVAATALMLLRARRTVCSSCRSGLTEENEHCAACGGALFYPQQTAAPIAEPDESGPVTTASLMEETNADEEPELVN